MVSVTVYISRGLSVLSARIIKEVKVGTSSGYFDNKLELLDSGDDDVDEGDNVDGNDNCAGDDDNGNNDDCDDSNVHDDDCAGDDDNGNDDDNNT